MEAEEAEEVPEEALATVLVPTASELPDPFTTKQGEGFEMNRFEKLLTSQGRRFNPEVPQVLRIPQNLAFDMQGNAQRYSAMGRKPTMDALQFERSFKGWAPMGTSPGAFGTDAERRANQLINGPGQGFEAFQALATLIQANMPPQPQLRHFQLHVIDGNNIFNRKNHVNRFDPFEAAKIRLSMRQSELKRYGPVVLIQRTNITEQILGYEPGAYEKPLDRPSRLGLTEL